MSEIKLSLRAIFNAALEIADAPQRREYLTQACGTDTALRKSVEELIQAHDNAGRFLGGAGNTAQATAQNSTERIAILAPLSAQVGDKIGRYKLLQKIGEGGCGVVYMAEQQEPVRRRVALKVIK